MTDGNFSYVIGQFFVSSLFTSFRNCSHSDVETRRIEHFQFAPGIICITHTEVPCHHGKYAVHVTLRELCRTGVRMYFVYCKGTLADGNTLVSFCLVSKIKNLSVKIYENIAADRSHKHWLTL